MDKLIQKLTESLAYTSALFGGFFAWLYGPWEGIIVILIIMISLDYGTGILKAGYKKELSSEAGYKGLMKKVSILVVVALGALADKAIPSTNGAAQAAISIFYIANEGLSILENVTEMNVNAPKWLKEMLAQIKEKNDSQP